MKLLMLGDWCLPQGESFPSVSHESFTEAVGCADAVIANYEGSQSANGVGKVLKVGPHLLQSETSPGALSELGVTHVSLANNHSLDCGHEGLHNSVEALSATGIVSFGFQSELLGNRRIVRIGNPKVGGVALISGAEREFTSDSGASAATLDPISLQQAVEVERNAGYVAIAVLHGGIEYEHLPPPHLQRLARWLIDTGASMVVTHHPHVPGFVEHWKGQPIAWSLGDLWMPRHGFMPSQWAKMGYGALVDVNSDGKLLLNAIVPYGLDYTEGVIRSLDSKEQADFSSKQAKYLAIAKDPKRYRCWWQSLLNRKISTYQRKYSLAPIPKILWRRKLGLNRLFQFLINRHPQWALRQLNGLRCESHREIWIGSLESIFSGRDKIVPPEGAGGKDCDRGV